MRPKVPRDEIRAWIVAYHNEHEERPTQEQIATQFDMSQGYVSKVLTELDEVTPLPGETKNGRPPLDREEAIGRVLSYITGYMELNTWAPSRREIAAACGMTLSTVNHFIALLAARGLIEVGTQSRQIRFPWGGES